MYGSHVLNIMLRDSIDCKIILHMLQYMSPSQELVCEHKLVTTKLPVLLRINVSQAPPWVVPQKNVLIFIHLGCHEM